MKEFIALRQSAAGQAQLRLGRQRQRVAPHDGAAQDARRHRHRARALPGQPAGQHRDPRRPDRRRASSCPATAMPLVQSGRLKALAVTSSVRSVVLPDLPTVAEPASPASSPPPGSAWSRRRRRPSRSSSGFRRNSSRSSAATKCARSMLRIYFQPVGTAPERCALMREEGDRWGKVIRQRARGPTRGRPDHCRPALDAAPEIRTQTTRSPAVA